MIEGGGTLDLGIAFSALADLGDQFIVGKVVVETSVVGSSHAAFLTAFRTFNQLFYRMESIGPHLVLSR